jgi:hypothetical protein
MVFAAADRHAEARGVEQPGARREEAVGVVETEVPTAAVAHSTLRPDPDRPRLPGPARRAAPPEAGRTSAAAPQAPSRPARPSPAGSDRRSTRGGTPAATGAPRGDRDPGRNPAAGDEIVGEGGDRTQMCHRGAVTDLQGLLRQLGRIDQQRRYHPGQQRRWSLRYRAGPGAHQFRGVEGHIRRDGNSTVAVVGFPVWTSARTAASAANGCSRAERTAWSGLFDGAVAVLAPDERTPAGRQHAPAASGSRGETSPMTEPSPADWW